MAEEIKYRNLGAFSSAGGFNVKNADPIDSRQLVTTIGHIYEDGNWADVKPYPGLIVSAADSGEVRVYAGPAYDKNQPSVKPWQSEDNWKKLGAGSTQVAKYSDAVALIETAEVDGVTVVKNLGQVIYVTGTETIGDGEAAVTYEPGAYIVSGATSLSKLGTTTASGNLANDVATLQGKVGTLETKVGALETKVGTLESEMDAVEGRLDVVEPKVTALETFRDETYAADKAAIEKSITDNKAEVDTWKTETYAVDKAAIEKSITDNKAEVDTWKTETYAADKAAIEGDIDALETFRDTTYVNDKAALEAAIEAAQTSGDNSVKDVKVAGTTVVTDNVANITFEETLVETVDGELVASTSENAPMAKSVAAAIVELRGMVTSIPKFKIEVVTELPTTEIKDSYIYLMANNLTGEEDMFSEYIYVNNKWEKLGEIKVDMSQYYTKTEVDGTVGGINKAIEDLDTEFKETLKAYYKATEIDNLLTGKIDNATYNERVTAVNARLEALETAKADHETRIKALEDWKTEFVASYATDKSTLETGIQEAKAAAKTADDKAVTAQGAADDAHSLANDAYRLAETKLDSATYATDKAALEESIEAAQETADEALARKIAFTAETYTAAKTMATETMIGQVILVKNEETVTTGEEPNIVSNTYAAGPYIVIAAGEILSLSTSTGDVDADIATQLGSRIGAVETNLGTLQQTHTADKEALEKAITDLEGSINTTLEGYKVKDITVDGKSVGEVWEVLTITADDIDGIVNPKTEEPEGEE